MLWTDNGIDTNEATAAGNPGTEQSAVVDMMLLSQCDDLIVTYGSSFGFCAHGIGGIHGIYLYPGHHHDAAHVWHSRIITSEPCAWTVPYILFADYPDKDAIKMTFKALSPFWQHHSQCHWRFGFL